MKGLDPEHAPGYGEPCAADEPGAVWLSTPALMKEYFERPDLTQQVVANGWFSTGDIGCLDARGRLYLKGRERDEINLGGTKVYPADVESAVESFPAVAEACCFAGPGNALYDETVAVAVVLAGNANVGDNLRELGQWTRGRLAAYQLPARWYLVEQIPKSPRGKVRTTDVQQLCRSLEPVRIPESE